MPVVATIRSRHPDVSQAAMLRMQREAADTGLGSIQKKFLPRHFLRTATQYYPEQYGMLYDKLRRNPTKQPLVKTGLTRAITLNGTPSFTGAGNRRKMIIHGLPRYFYMLRNYQPGGFHKQRALEAINDQEIAEVVTIIDTQLTALLKASI